MANQTPTPVDPEELERAKETWSGFTKLLKWSIIITALTLILLVLIFH